MNYSKYIRNSLCCLITTALPSALSAQGLVIGEGIRFTMSGPVHLVIKDGGFTNSGFFTAGNSTVHFTGSQPAFEVSSRTTLGFYKIKINKSPATQVTFLQDLTVNDTIDMIGGNVNMNNTSMYFGSNGAIAGENNASRITGTGEGRIVVIRTVNKPLVNANLGNIGVELSSNVIPGLMAIERKFTPASIGDAIGIQRVFNIATTATMPVMPTIRILYFDGELNGQGESSLEMYSDSDIGNMWMSVGKDSQDIVNNWVLKAGLDRWGQYTLANAGNITMRTKTTGQADEKDPSFTGNVRLYPNPSRDQFTMELISKESKTIVLKLHDQSGRLLQQKQISCREGLNIISWNISGYASGIYYIGSESNDLKNIKMIKQ